MSNNFNNDDPDLTPKVVLVTPKTEYNEDNGGPDPFNRQTVYNGQVEATRRAADVQLAENDEDVINIGVDAPTANESVKTETDNEDVGVINIADSGADDGDYIQIEMPKVEDTATVVEKEIRIISDPTKTYKPLTVGRVYEKTPAILPSDHVTSEQTDELYETWRKILKDTIKTPNDKKKAENLLNNLARMALTTHVGDYTEFFSGPIENYETSIDPIDGKTPIKIGHPGIRLPENLERLTGEAATLVVGKQMKSGAPTRVPCWHSGLVLNLSTFPDREIVDYGINVGRIQLNIGMDAIGATFTGDDIYMVGPALDMVLGHITNCQLKAFTPVTLRKLLLATDIPAILAGALEAIYPEGYPIHHVCVNPNCNYVLTAERDARGGFVPDSLLNFSQVLKPDRTKLSATQIRHMSKGNGSLTVEDVQKYQSELQERLWGDKNTFVIWEDSGDGWEESVSVVFKVPTIDEYLTMAYEWVTNITIMADAMLRTEPSWKTDEEKAKAKTNYISRYAEMSDLTKNMCWVDKIISVGRDGIPRSIYGEDDIRNTLEECTKADGVRATFDKAAQKFKEMSLVAWTGIPNFACPECKTSQVKPNSVTPALIPLNMVGYFFSTMAYR